MMYLTEDSTRFDLPWETLEALSRGVSSIDLTTMPMSNREEAYEFVLHYGYDLHHPEDAQEVQAIFEEAVRFIETQFLSTLHDWSAYGEQLAPADSIPPHLLEGTDTLDLMMQAAHGEGTDQQWACAILKVMHTMAHIQNGPLYKYFDEAKRQILSQFHQILTPLDYGNEVLLGKPGGTTLRLFGFETKDQKTRESILVKLLCKKEHVAEAIWDLIGVRLITNTSAEAIFALNILRHHKVIVFPNIIPSRSRNTLVDISRFRAQYEEAVASYHQGTMSLAEFEDFIPYIEAHPVLDKDFTAHNPSSSQHYRSIHVTCRQLIRLKSAGMEGEHRFFFPYEIQILDKTNYLESKEGSSAHNLYKRKQLAMARRRVLGLLLKA